MSSRRAVPWKTVVGNVTLGRCSGRPKSEAQPARDWLRRVGLAGFEDHHPHQLSGGMRKRVSLAAALINEPSILLMDEPFGALDVQTKAIMSNELLGLWEQTDRRSCSSPTTSKKRSRWPTGSSS